MEIKIVFFGSSNYPLPILDILKKDRDFKISLIITRPDRVVGRKKILMSNPVKVWSFKNNIPVITPKTFDGEDLELALEKFREIKPDLGLIAHFGLLIPKEIFSFPKYQTINIHFSLLPKYRGAAPIQHAIINGDKETGITILKIAEKFDTGDILYQKKIPLLGNETVDNLYKTLYQKTTQFLPVIIKKYIRGEIKPLPQDENLASFAPKLTTEDGKINWSKPAQVLERFIRGINPDPGAWTEVKINKQIKRLKILNAHLEKGKLILDLVQVEGKKPVKWQEFNRLRVQWVTRV